MNAEDYFVKKGKEKLLSDKSKSNWITLDYPKKEKRKPYLTKDRAKSRIPKQKPGFKKRGRK